LRCGEVRLLLVGATSCMTVVDSVTAQYWHVSLFLPSLVVASTHDRGGRKFSRLKISEILRKKSNAFVEFHRLVLPIQFGT
jgi:hypothetical protein